MTDQMLERIQRRNGLQVLIRESNDMLSMITDGGKKSYEGIRLSENRVRFLERKKHILACVILDFLDLQNQ